MILRRRMPNHAPYVLRGKLGIVIYGTKGREFYSLRAHRSLGPRIGSDVEPVRTSVLLQVTSPVILIYVGIFYATFHGSVCNRRGKNGVKIGLRVVESAEDRICHKPMLYQLSYAHQRTVMRMLRKFSAGCNRYSSRGDRSIRDYWCAVGIASLSTTGTGSGP
jgi:hypothetical protein